MKSVVLLYFIYFITTASVPVHTQESPTEAILSNISYGSHERHVLDIYLPAGRNESVTKVILLVHGGRWIEGDKQKMDEYIPWLRSSFPLYAVANMNYRWATVDDPAYPKQIDDIQSVLDHLTSRAAEYQILPEFALFGRSSGAHISLLFGYSRDQGQQVKAIAALVPLVDFWDPGYLLVPGFFGLVMPLIGNVPLVEIPGALLESSPKSHVTRDSPSTIAFYGGVDPLVPVTQAQRLEGALNYAGVVNKYHMYPEEDHSFDDPDNLGHMRTEVEFFFNRHL